MYKKPELDKKQVKMKGRITSLYALLVLVICMIVAIVLSMQPINSVTGKRDSVSITMYYFDGNIDTTGVSLNSTDARRIKSFNDNRICVSVFRTAEANEVATKNFVLSWLYVNYPALTITDDSLVFTEKKWRKSHDACDDTYMSNVFQYEKRMAQTDISMNNMVTNWWLSGLILFLGSLNVIMVLWFISLYKDELEHYKNR